jgi:hypothetical protein
MPRRRSPPPPIIEDVSALVRAGYGGLVTFDNPGAWIELAGPRGGRGGDGATWRAPVTTVRLVREGQAGIVAEAAADGAFARMLDTLAEHARPFSGDDHVTLVAMLRAVRELSAKPRTRMPTVGPGLVEHGEPSLDAWLSCLTLADLERSLEESCEYRTAA